MALTYDLPCGPWDSDSAIALSEWSRAWGYIVAGVGALACGLLTAHRRWHAPLIMGLVVLCGQIWSGTARSGRSWFSRKSPSRQPRTGTGRDRSGPCHPAAGGVDHADRAAGGANELT